MKSKQQLRNEAIKDFRKEIEPAFKAYEKAEALALEAHKKAMA